MKKKTARVLRFGQISELTDHQVYGTKIKIEKGNVPINYFLGAGKSRSKSLIVKL